MKLGSPCPAVINHLLAVLAEKTGKDVENARHCLRVSHKGNIVISAPVVISKNLLNHFGAESVEDVNRLLSCITPEAAERIVAWANEAKNGDFRNIRELKPKDFCVPREIAAGEKDSLYKTFVRVHSEYSSGLGKTATEVFGTAAAEDLLPAGIRQCLRCSPGPEDVNFSRSGTLKTTAECRCGFTAVLAGGNGRPSSTLVSKDHQELISAAAQYYFRRYSSVRLADEIKAACQKANEIRNLYYLNAQAAKAAEDLDSLLRGLEGRQLRYGGNGSWYVGSLRFDSITPESLRAFAGKALTAVEKGALVRKEKARERVRQLWALAGEPVCAGYEEVWAGLPVTVKFTPSVVNAYNSLKKLVETWTNGNITVSPKNELLVNGVKLEELDEEAVRRSAKLVFNSFKNAAEAARAKAAGYDQGVVLKVLRFVADNPEKMGATTVAAVLAGSRAKKVAERKLSSLSGYGSLRGVATQKDLARIVGQMVNDGLLRVKRVGWHDMPVLRVPGETEGMLKALGGPEMPPLQKQMSIQEAVGRRSWDALAEMASGGDWAAEVALNVAAALWPGSKAAKALKT